MDKITVIPFAGGCIRVCVTEAGAGSILSEGLKTQGDPDTTEEQAFNDAVDGMEALILGLACAGVDVSTKEFGIGVVSAIDAITNNI